MFSRYALYETPDPSTDLARFGASWLGWDSASGTSVPHPAVPLDLPVITNTPRKYGFHGTLKPPFRLADGQSEDTLITAVEAFCDAHAPLVLDGLRLARLGRFLALVPVDDAAPLADLAANVVSDLDLFRAPMTPDELSKRRANRLSPAQDAHLMRWGYPYVMDQFRFHMTLTGRLDPLTAETVEAALEQMLAPITLAPYTVSSLTLLGEDAAGQFHQIMRCPLSG